MIKQGLKNYFRCFKYIFTPLGVLALAIVWGLSIAVPGISSAFSQLGQSIWEIAQHASIDFSAMLNSLRTEVEALDWSNPAQALEALLSYDWLNNTITNCVNALGGEAEAVASQIGTAVTETIVQLLFYITVFVLFLFLGITVGHMITKMLVRNAIAKRSYLKMLLLSVADTLFSSILVLLLVGLLTFGSIGMLLIVIAGVLGFGCISMLEAYLANARKKIPLKAILNFRNIGKLILTDALLLLMNGGIVLVLYALTNPIVGTILGIVLNEIVFLVVSMNAESYVLHLVQSVTSERSAA